MQRYGTQNQL